MQKVWFTYLKRILADASEPVKSQIKKFKKGLNKKVKIDNEKLAVAIANEGLLLKEFADKAGIQELTLRKIRKGETTPRTATVGKIAKALNVDVKDIIRND